jgi:hypothetical protein
MGHADKQAYCLGIGSSWQPCMHRAARHMTRNAAAGHALTVTKAMFAVYRAARQSARLAPAATSRDLHMQPLAQPLQQGHMREERTNETIQPAGSHDMCGDVPECIHTCSCTGSQVPALHWCKTLRSLPSNCLHLDSGSTWCTTTRFSTGDQLHRCRQGGCIPGGTRNKLMYTDTWRM